LFWMLAEDPEEEPLHVILKMSEENFEPDQEDNWQLDRPREKIEKTTELMEEFYDFPSEMEKEFGIPEVEMVEAQVISDSQHRRECRWLLTIRIAHR
jgi:hypothetical protein